jgi:hypothetical protein
MIKHLPLASIRRDGGTQMRAEIDMLVVAEYAEAYREGADMPPLVAFHDGKDCWLADGFHRLLGAEKAGLEKIACDLRPGSKRDALLFACGANAAHGLRRTNEDKHKAVETILILFDRERKVMSDGTVESNGEIAQICAVSEGLVRIVRRELEASSKITKMTSRRVKRGAAVFTQDTSNIGKSQQSTPLPGQGDLFDDEETSEAEDEPESTEDESEGPVPEESGPEPDDGPADEEDSADDEVNGQVPKVSPLHTRFLEGLDEIDDFTRAVAAPRHQAGYGGFPEVYARIPPDQVRTVMGKIRMLHARLADWSSHPQEVVHD